MVVPGRVAPSVGFGVVVFQSEWVIHEGVGTLLEPFTLLDLDDESAGYCILVGLDHLPDFAQFLELVVDGQPHSHHQVDGTHHSLVEVDWGRSTNHWRHISPTLDDHRPQVHNCPPKVVSFAAFRTPHIHVELPFVDISEEELILSYLEAKL